MNTPYLFTYSSIKKLTNRFKTRNVVCTFMFSFCFALYGQTYQITPECSMQIQQNSYHIVFQMPNYEINEADEEECGIFSEIEINGECDETDTPGFPELPIFSLCLQLPDDATNVRVTFVPEITDLIDIPYYLLPAASGLSDTEDCYDARYYEWNDPIIFYNNFYEWNLINYKGSNGIALSIFPFDYMPLNYQANVLNCGIFTITYDGTPLSDMITDMMAETDYRSTAIKLMYDTYNTMNFEADPSDKGSYHIIASDRFNENEWLNYFVDYKTNIGYNVSLSFLGDFGGSGNANAIINYIVDKYSDFVLLVGDISEIPPTYESRDPNNPYTDILYGIGNASIGRWIINGNEDLDYVVNKTINAELSYADASIYATLFSGIDDSNRACRKFNKGIRKVADVSFNNLGIAYDLYYGNTGVGIDEMLNGILTDPMFFIYRGHGNVSAIALPYDLYVSDINNEAHSIKPMGFGFACLLNGYYNICFGQSWVSSSNGGVSFYGATTESERSANNKLSKKIFKVLKQQTNKSGNTPLGLMIDQGELKYYNACRNDTRRNQIHKYVLIGDPSLYVYGINQNNGNPEPLHAPKLSSESEYSAATPINNQEQMLTLSENTVYISIFDLQGHLMFRNHTVGIKQISLNSFSSGIYLIQILDNTGNMHTKKIIIY